jgi:DNA mismatch endonuclease (patch repair protein)
MRGNRRSDTKPEVRLRSALHGLGLRFRKDVRIDLPGRRVRPDVVFGPSRVAVFVDGCFWHRCPEHATEPKTNADFWRKKFGRNVRRDEADNAALRANGWTVIRIWEHEPATKAARDVADVVAACRARHAAAATGGFVP